jgi:hypothetical protein
MPVFSVESRIFFLRRQKVILDTDLAQLYGVSVKRLNEQMKRNQERFPSDFMFRLTTKEDGILRSQIATSKVGRGGRRNAPYAFTEHGANHGCDCAKFREGGTDERLCGTRVCALAGDAGH